MLLLSVEFLQLPLLDGSGLKLTELSLIVLLFPVEPGELLPKSGTAFLKVLQPGVGCRIAFPQIQITGEAVKKVQLAERVQQIHGGTLGMNVEKR